MAARIEFGKYRLTWVNGDPKVAWSYKDKDGNLVRPRHSLPGVTKASTVAELRAALVAFAARQEREELQKSASTVGAILDAYAANRERDGKVMRPILSNIRQLKPFFGHMAPGDISEDLCRAYTKERATPRPTKNGSVSCSGSTILTELGRLSTAIQWAIDKKIITEAERPVMWFPQASPARDRVLTPAEAAALLDAAQGHTRLFILTCLLTGGRTTAILELTWDRVDFVNGTVNLKVPRQVNLLKKEVKKGRAIVHMTDMLRAALVEAKERASTNHVIEHNGRPVLRVTTSFETAVRNAGLGDDVTPHTLRHTAATWADAGMVPVEQISKMLGHKNVNTTKRNYAHGETAHTIAPAELVASQLPKLRVVK